MSIWLEIHCDDSDKSRIGCSGLTHDYAMGFARTGSRVRFALRILALEAYRRGWTKVHGRWYCKACSKARATR